MEQWGRPFYTSQIWQNKSKTTLEYVLKEGGPFSIYSDNLQLSTAVFVAYIRTSPSSTYSVVVLDSVCARRLSVHHAAMPMPANTAAIAALPATPSPILTCDGAVAAK